jgi:hypothetical protein
MLGEDCLETVFLTSSTSTLGFRLLMTSDLFDRQDCQRYNLLVCGDDLSSPEKHSKGLDD